MDFNQGINAIHDYTLYLINFIESYCDYCVEYHII
jgi:hypothetical protein